MNKVYRLIKNRVSGVVQVAPEFARAKGTAGTLGLGLAVLCIAPAAMATSFVINDGQTVTTQQTLNDGETGVIQSGGSLETGANTAIEATGASVTVTNDGSISTTGGVGYGISATGANTTITNSGTVSTTQNSAYGIWATGANTTITNSGSISTTGVDGVGINAYGADATISNSGSITTEGSFSQGIYSNADNATISNSGSISTAGSTAYGIYAYDAYATITNSGTIGTAGDFAYGIFAYGANATVTNSGTINTTGLWGYGIYADDAYATVTNSGSISTTGSSGYGILSNADYATITNSGSITTTGESARGIESYGNYAIITNSGTISTANTSADGILAEGYSEIINSGTISGSGDYTAGISATGGDTTLTNSGSISSSGDYGVGIYVNGSESSSTVNNSGSIRITGASGVGIESRGYDTITNSGLIWASGAGSYAIYDSAGSYDHTVNILPGSRILGAIDLNDGSDTANIHGAYGSAVMTFANTETINVLAPNAVLVGGDMVIVVEPTGESSRGVVLDGLTSGIHNTLSQRMRGTRPIVPIELASLEMSPGMRYQERAPYAWGQVFGSKSSRDAEGMMLDLDTRMSGFVAGYEQDYHNGRIGFMAGAAHSSVETDTLNQDINTIFAGVYGHAFLGWANLSASLIAGGESHDQDRIVLDNLNGYETARSDTHSLFVSPSLTLSQVYTLNSTNELRPSMTVSYSLGRYDGYTETGTTNANLRVDNRTVQALSGRLQGEWAHALDAGEVSVRLGVQSRSTSGDAIKMSVGGNNLRFDAMGDKHAAGGYLGFGARLNIGKQLHLLADVEAGHMSGGEEQLSGQLTLQYPF